MDEHGSHVYLLDQSLHLIYMRCGFWQLPPETPGWVGVREGVTAWPKGNSCGSWSRVSFPNGGTVKRTEDYTV